MPAYHWKKLGGLGTTMINIGVGPTNAKTISDHLAVLRPRLFFMLGHCAGLRATQRLGHYVVATGYVRVDRVLDPWLHQSVAIPQLQPIEDEMVLAYTLLKRPPSGAIDSENRMLQRLRRGTVATVLDRNWELRYPNPTVWPFDMGKCVAVEMESATIAANGFRYSIPYASFLCVSDRPLHGELKMEGMAESFYRSAVAEHFQIAIRAVENLSTRLGVHGLLTRQLRASRQPPFQ
jgi:AMP nucleosidase